MEDEPYYQDTLADINRDLDQVSSDLLALREMHYHAMNSQKIHTHLGHRWRSRLWSKRLTIIKDMQREKMKRLEVLELKAKMLQ